MRLPRNWFKRISLNYPFVLFLFYSPSTLVLEVFVKTGTKIAIFLLKKLAQIKKCIFLHQKCIIIQDEKSDTASA